MSKKRKAPQPLSYKDFRTGYDYAFVYYTIYNRKWKRRNGVLGAWRELKKKMYKQYLVDFAAEHDVPF